METKVRSWREALHPVFADCVGLEDGRYALAAPFFDGMWVGATDGRICVRTIKTVGIKDVIPTPSTKTPPLDSVYGGLFGDGVPIPPFTESEDETKECNDCGGGGLCNRCDCEAEHNCGYCSGTGQVRREAKRIKLLADASPLSDIYLRRLAKHGAVLYPPKGSKAKTAPWKFTVGDNVEGRLMPMTDE